MKVFRVWDESTNTMYYPGHDGTQLVFGITCAYGEEGHHTWQLWDAEGEITREGKAELMQHTGLRDKDGIEIYENDILACPDGINRVVEYCTEEASYKARHMSDEPYCEPMYLEG